MGLLVGLLTETGGDISVDTGWFGHASTALGSADQRLGSLATLATQALAAAPSSPPVFDQADWREIPDGLGDAPFCVVVGPETGGEIGLGGQYTATLDNTTFTLFAYLPLVEYSDTGATMLVGGATHPLQIGLSVATVDGKGFTVDGQTFKTLEAVGYVYLDAAAYSTAPPAGYFKLEFAPLATYTTLAGLESAESLVASRLGQVLVQSGPWLDTPVGNAPVSIGSLLVAGGLLTVDDAGYHFDLSILAGRSAQDIATSFLFGVLDELADPDVPYAVIEMPGGGLFFVRSENADGSTDYGMRLALDVAIERTDAGASPRPEIDITFGSWLTGEVDGTDWISRSLGADQKEPVEPGVSVYLLRHGPDGLTFNPSFSIASVGVNLRGGSNTPLLSIGGVTLGGVEVRAYLDERNGWQFGAAARADDLGIPLGPNFGAAAGGGQSNPVASSLVSSGSGGAGGGAQQPVNPTLSLSACKVEGGTFELQLYDRTGSPTDVIVLPVQRSLGPLSVQRLGVGWLSASEKLSVLIDGGVQVGELSIYLSGLSVGIPVKDPADFSSYDLDLDGIGITFASGDVELSAAFVKVPKDAEHQWTEYDGEVLITAGDFSIIAVGSYAYVPVDQSGYTSLFVFGVLDGDLGGPPFFYVTGLAAGFGYNRALVLPAQDAVTTFPLVQAASDPTALGATKQQDGSLKQPDPAVALARLGASVPPQSGEYWLAAGVRFTSFDFVNSTALLTVEFGNELEIGLLGLSQISLPPPAAPGAAEPSDPYAYVELGIEVKLLPSAGALTATAILSPNSFVLDPACKLTGGFAFSTWFGSSEHAGEFVVTVGGYHPDFQPPSYYPSVPRLAFDWAMGGDVTVRGDAYFALTTSALMVGGALDVVFAQGDLRAWLSAHMDALVEWAPLHYEIHIGISVGVSYRLDLLFVTTTLTVELGADLTIWGPPTGGSVHISWAIISFTVSFGADRSDAPQPLDWMNASGTGFAQTLLPHTAPPAAPPTEVLALTTGPPPTQPAGVCTIAIASGLITTFQDGPATVSVVNPATFAFSIASAIPATEIDVVGPSGSTPIRPQPENASLYIRPMSATLSSSKVTLTVTASDKSTVAIFDDFNLVPVFASVPAAKWGQPPAAGSDPEMTQTLPGRLIGLTGITPKAPTLTPGGESELSVVAEDTFTDFVVDANAPAHLPLDPAAQPPVTTPQLDTQPGFATLSGSLAAAANVRDEIFHALRGYGVDPGTNGTLGTLAKEPGAYLTGRPLLERALTA